MKKYIRQLIMEGKVKEAIEKLVNFIEVIEQDIDVKEGDIDEIYNQAITIANQKSEIDRKQVTGVASHEQVNLESNRILNDTLKLLDYFYGLPVVERKNNWLDKELKKVESQSNLGKRNKSYFVEDAILNQIQNGIQNGNKRIEDIWLEPIVDSKLEEEIEDRLQKIRECFERGDFVRGRFLFKKLKNDISGNKTIIEFENELSKLDNKNKNINTNFETAENLEIINDKIKPGLNVQNISLELAKVIINLRDESGMMIGIFGRWGRGKTYFWKQLKSYFERNNKPYISIEFHAWKYQNIKALWAYLYEAFLHRYYEKPEKFSLSKYFKYYWKKTKLNFYRKGWTPILKTVAILLIGGIVSYQLKSWNDEEIINSISSAIGVSIASVSTLIGILTVMRKEYGSAASDLLKQFSGEFSFKELLGVQAEIQKEIILLLKVWLKNTNKRILFFVDDLDRCSKEQMLKTIDSIRIMLDDKEISNKIIVLSAIDERLLRDSIKLKYQDDFLVREHMDKLFLISLKLPELNNKEKNEIFDLLTIEREKVRLPKVNINEGLEGSSNISKTITQSGEKENVKNIYKYENNVLNENIGLEDSEEFDLTFIEYNTIQNLLPFFDYATPRGIRIFYNRYLLAKNLLKLKLKEDSVIKRKWVETLNQDILPALIIQFSIHNTSEEIPVIRKKIESMQEDILNYEVLEREYYIDKELLINILTIVEMVVAY